MPVLSIVIPVYNEIATIEEILKRVVGAPLPDGISREIIIVDDKSSDGTKEFLEKLGESFKIVFHNKNKGKGAAVRTGLKYATGDFVVIQDADLEYNPNEIKDLLNPLLDGKADVVYGSRFMSGRPHAVLRFWHYVGNKIITIISNAFTNLYLTDMETCYKMFTRAVVDDIVPQLTSEGFEIEPEITARIAKKKYRIYEIGISYGGRSRSEGKKIGWRDGFSAVWAILKYNLWT